MAEMLSKESARVGKEECQLWDLPPTQIALQNSELVSFHPLTSISNNPEGPYEFMVYSNHEFIDFSQVFVLIEFNVKNEDGTNLAWTAATPAVSFVNNLGMGWVKQIRATPLAMESQLRLKPARYPIKRLLTKTFHIDAGRFDLPSNPLFQGQLPRRLTICMCANAAYHGAYNKDPYSFDNFGLREFHIMVNNKMVPTEGLKMDWRSNHFSLAYINTMSSLGLYGDDRSNDIGLSQFKKGSFIMVFNLAPGEDAGAWELSKQGSITAHGRFSAAVPPEGIRLVAMAEYDSLLQIDGHRNVIVDYSL